MHMLKKEVAEKLKELIEPMEGRRILEVGTGWGESAAFFSALKPGWNIYTIDAYGLYGDGRIYQEYDHDKVKKIIDSLPPNVIQILGDSSSVPWELEIDVLFIDGDHSYEGCHGDYCQFNGWLTKGGILCFDDYNQPNNPLNGVRRVVDHIIEFESDRYKLIHHGFYSAIFQKL